MNYDVDYFIQKFEAIPEKFWIVGKFHCGHKHCAQGHIKDQHRADEAGEMSERLHGLLMRVCTGPKAEIGNAIARVNDGREPDYQQPTPKARILAALRDVKAKEAK
jgi:uncharacterized protein YdbL (DUF1318 family)